MFNRSDKVAHIKHNAKAKSRFNGYLLTVIERCEANANYLLNLKNEKTDN